jgi:hypothetical protein
VLSIEIECQASASRAKFESLSFILFFSKKKRKKEFVGLDMAKGHIFI